MRYSAYQDELSCAASSSQTILAWQAAAMTPAPAQAHQPQAGVKLRASVGTSCHRCIDTRTHTCRYIEYTCIRAHAPIDLSLGI